MRALLLAALGGTIATSCLNDNTQAWDAYKDWRESNEKFFLDQSGRLNPDGTPFYTAVSPAWNPTATVLMRWLNDRSLTAENYSPLYNSACYVKYHGRLMDGVAFDSSYTARASYGDSLALFRPSGVVQGFGIALQNMHVGDSCEVVIPYWLGYQAQASGKVLPYSDLIFTVKLAGLDTYEVRPK